MRFAFLLKQPSNPPASFILGPPVALHPHRRPSLQSPVFNQQTHSPTSVFPSFKKGFCLLFLTPLLLQFTFDLTSCEDQSPQPFESTCDVFLGFRPHSPKLRAPLQSSSLSPSWKNSGSQFMTASRLPGLDVRLGSWGDVLISHLVLHFKSIVWLGRILLNNPSTHSGTASGCAVDVPHR